MAMSVSVSPMDSVIDEGFDLSFKYDMDSVIDSAEWHFVFVVDFTHEACEVELGSIPHSLHGPSSLEYSVSAFHWNK